MTFKSKEEKEKEYILLTMLDMKFKEWPINNIGTPKWFYDIDVYKKIPNRQRYDYLIKKLKKENFICNNNWVTYKGEIFITNGGYTLLYKIKNIPKKIIYFIIEGLFIFGKL
jgi:hypothetical protein